MTEHLEPRGGVWPLGGGHRELHLLCRHIRIERGARLTERGAERALDERPHLWRVPLFRSKIADQEVHLEADVNHIHVGPYKPEHGGRNVAIDDSGDSQDVARLLGIEPVWQLI